MNLERSNLIVKRYIECSKKGELDQGDEVRLLQYLFNRLHMVGIADAAKRKGMSYNGMKRRVNQSKEMHVETGNQIFVSA